MMREEIEQLLNELSYSAINGRSVNHAVIAKAIAAERERCAKIADEWAKSVSCCLYPSPCEHIRTGAAIAERIRKDT